MKKILVRYNEIYLKGHNRGIFEKLLWDNIKKTLCEFENIAVKRIQGRFLIENFADNMVNRICNKLEKVLGVYSYSVATVIKSDLEKMREAALTLSKELGSFKVNTRRADKTFPISSMDVSKNIGGYILERKPALTVDVFKPDFEINIEIREDGNTYIFSDIVKCCGGLPVGCSGSGLLMLSGGIDSPVAGYMMAKRGMKIDCLHFHSYPYTSELAKEKVLRLAKILKNYAIDVNVHVVSFTEIQTSINKHCNEEYTVILMRRIMMRVANILSEKFGYQAIVTGENLAQVASQTVESLTVTNAIASKPVLRPLIAFDKVDIIEIARKIDTYETSIEPYEDCCTIFLPKRPIIKPKLDKVLIEEEKLNIDVMIENALKSMETYVI